MSAINESVISMSDVPRTFKYNFKANVPVMLQGASGIGKTDLALAYANEQGDDYGLFEINLATASLPDLIGLQMPRQQSYIGADGEPVEITVSKFAYPYFMFDKRNGRPAFTFNRGMVVLEEYGQATGDVKRATAPIIREKRNGEYLFPAQTDVLLLSNRPEDRSGVSKDFDFLINRRNQLTLHADIDAWLVWAHANGVTPMSMAFAKRNTDKVFANKAPEKQGPWLTPRSLKSADDFLQVAMADGTHLDDPIIAQNLGGIIGQGYTHVYIAFAKVRDQLPSYSSILQDPEGTRVPTEPDQMMFLAFDLASKVDRNNIKPIVKYIKRMPSDLSVAFYRAATQRDKSLVSTSEFGDWAVSNLQLLSAVNAR